MYHRLFVAIFKKIQVDLPFLERQVAEKRAERDDQNRKDLAFAAQMIKDSNLAVVLEAREKEVCYVKIVLMILTKKH